MDRGMVFFDVDGTLTDTPASWRIGALRLLERNRLHLGDVDADTWYESWAEAARRHFERFMGGEISFVDQGRERMREIFEAAGLEIADDVADRELATYRADCYAHMPLYEEVIEVLDLLSDRPIGVITNGQIDQQVHKLRLHGLEDRFQPVVVSEMVGVPKPDSRVFAEAARRAGVAAERCLYVGDMLDVDARGARDAGMFGVWLNRTGQPADTDGLTVISTLRELPGVIEQWEQSL